MNTTPSIFMPSPINAVLEGLYEANTTMAELKSHGDFGIGTFNDLDGEMIMVDGQIYQMDINGCAHSVDDDERTPFAAVCRFKAISTDPIDQPVDADQFDNLLDKCLPSRNMMYAIRIEGLFSKVRTRAVKKTANYTPLAEATSAQKESIFENVEGTLVGFYTPDFIPSVNVPGYHFHFIMADRTHGGHLLECGLSKGSVAIQFYTRLDLNLPLTLDYLSAEFNRDATEDLKKAER